VLPIMLAALCEEGEAHLLEDARALYEHHERDAGDTILMAFKAGNWTKVIFLLSQPPEHLQGFGNVVLIVQGGIINLTAVLIASSVGTIHQQTVSSWLAHVLLSHTRLPTVPAHGRCLWQASLNGLAQMGQPTRQAGSMTADKQVAVCRCWSLSSSRSAWRPRMREQLLMQRRQCTI